MPSDRLLDEALDAAGRVWLAEAEARCAADPDAVARLFPAARRACGRGTLPTGRPMAEAARIRLLLALPLRGAELGRAVFDLYRHGDTAERLAVLRGLDPLDRHRALGEAGLPIVRDALRTNDTRLIEAAAGPYAAARLDDDAYRQAVLKCVFVGVPVASVAGLADRADGELARMAADHARERRAAGRDVPPDVERILRLAGEREF
ncbi:EboA domain-containing protein [Actinomadura kijaniata]|uniref:Sugar phosphate isomerase n=1 Tax=Actinomadura namibiensis TaxID=182080 RepID=A0A7W3LTN0_ACTNM|nr:EboA domain-containing protein [Actinomadura namibiensis]MBA8954108.1 hypothetical protein [Actinomadura namibiensis]